MMQLKPILFVVLLGFMHVYGIDMSKLSQPLNILVLLDHGASYDNHMNQQADGTVKEIINAIDQKVPFIASSHLVYLAHVTIKKVSGLSWFTDNWTLYQTEGSEFIVAYPQRNFSPMHLMLHGINSAILLPLSSTFQENSDNSSKAFSMAHNPVNTGILQQLFINPHAPKRIYLSGHGTFSGELIKRAEFKPSIAGLDVSSYIDFLQYLNTQGTQFVFVSSCYTGGFNLLAYQERDQNITKELKPNYFLAIGSTTDAIATTGIINFTKFFKEVDAFFAPQGKMHKGIFKEMLKALNMTGKLDALPSLRFPGKINYFKVINITDDVEIFTYSNTTAAVLEPKLLPIFGKTNKEDRAKVKLRVVENKAALLFYPLYIPVPISIKLVSHLNPPLMLSMIPGHAFHLFNEIELKDKTLPEFVEKMIYGLAVSDLGIISEKVFFIKNLQVQYTPELGLPESKLEYVVIDKEISHNNSLIIAKCANNYYKASIMRNVNEGGVTLGTFKEIPAFTAQILTDGILKKIKGKIVPSAVQQASGGHENIDDVYNKIRDIFLKGMPNQ